MTKTMDAFGSGKTQSTTNSVPVPIQYTHKDSLFSALYSEKDTILDLYRSLHPDDSPVTEEQIELITLSNNLVVRRYNDVAFTVSDRLLVLTEHQSTINRNMPLRMLFYVAEEYERLLGNKRRGIYGHSAVKLPAPEFYVVYTGNNSWNVGDEIRLSKAFIGGGTDPSLDLRVKVITGADTDSTLQGYFELVRFMKSNLQNGKVNLDKIEGFIDSFSGSKLFKLFLLKLKGEEIMKLFNMEYDYETERQVLLEEGIEKGIEKGIKKGREEGIRASAELLFEVSKDKELVLRKVAEKYDISVNRVKGILGW